MNDDDTCQPITVTGEDGEEVTAIVHGGKDAWTEKDRWAFGEIVRAAQRKYGRDHPDHLDTQEANR